MYYTYLIKHLPTNRFYYGVRFSKNNKGADLWVRYFTSSSYVHKLIEEYGKDSFVCEIRKTFNDKIHALNWEKKVLRRMKVSTRDDFINVNPGRGYGFAEGKKHWAWGKTYTEEHKENNRKGQKEKPAWRLTPSDHPSRLKLSKLASERFKGRKQTEEHINKRKMFGKDNPMYGKQHTEEHKKLISEASRRAAQLAGEEHAGTKNLIASVKKRFENGTHPSKIETVCPHCNRSIKGMSNYKRWHGDNCISYLEK